MCAMGMCLLNRSLGTRPLSSNGRGDTHSHRESRLTTEELMEAVFSLWSNPKLYKEANSLLKLGSDLGYDCSSE
jgi:hypothetical protein